MSPVEPLDRIEAEHRYAAFQGLARRRRSRRRAIGMAGTAVGVGAVAAALIWAGVSLSGLGRGDRAVPASPNAGASIAVGSSGGCAVTATGGVRCWGSKTGDGTRLDRTRPVSVAGLDAVVVSVSAGWEFACAVLDEGSVACWGANTSGQLGDGSTARGYEPVTVIGLSDAARVATGGGHTCAISSAGALSCWGANGAGQLGDGSGIQRSVPEPVLGLRAGVVDAVAGYRHTCALTDAGKVKCWGANEYGQLGDGTKVDRAVPKFVPGLDDVVAISGNGADHTCALIEGGDVRCWGSNRVGQIGDGTRTDRPVPTPVNELPAGVIALSAGERDTCVLTSAGTVSCWGSGDRGQLGRDPIVSRHPNSAVPIPMTKLPADVVTISMGAGSACVLTGSGELSCWGNNADGELGSGLRRGLFSIRPRHVAGDWLLPH